jgi:hypothetical protein
VALESDFDNDAALAGEILLLSEKMQEITTKTSQVKFLKKKNIAQQKEVHSLKKRLTRMQKKYVILKKILNKTKNKESCNAFLNFGIPNELNQRVCKKTSREPHSTQIWGRIAKVCCYSIFLFPKSLSLCEEKI